MPSIDLTDEELALIREALDSHEYWQLSEPHERNNGYSLVGDGVDDEIDACRALDAKLVAAVIPSPSKGRSGGGQDESRIPSDP